MVEKECVICKSYFYTDKPKTTKYCSNTCRVQATKEKQKGYMKKYMAKKKAEKLKKKNELDSRIVQPEDLVMPTRAVISQEIDVVQKEEQPKVLMKKSDIKIGDVTSVRSLAKQIGTARFEIVDELKKLREELNKMELAKIKNDHRLESCKEVTDKDLIEIGSERYRLVNERREIKCKIQMLDILIRDMPENPDKFVYDMIQHQEKLDDIYDRKKKWDIEKWTVSDERSMQG